MNTQPTWSDSPIHEQIRDAGLDPVNGTTNDTPTPDTDEHEFPCMTWPSRAHPMVVRADFARKLERERDEAREQHQILYEQTGNTIYEARKQRDEAVNNYETAQLLSIRVGEQRDSLIKAIEPLEYWRDISECDCSCPLPQGGCLRCDLNRILKLTKPKA